jgi:hypothetical protein
MPELAWSSGHDARSTATVQQVATELTAPLAKGCIRPLVAARRAGKTWMLRALEHVYRATHGARFHDLAATDALPTPTSAVGLWLLDEPGTLLAGRTEQLVEWARAQAHPPVVAMTPRELALLRANKAGEAACAQRSEVWLPLPTDDELAAVVGDDTSTIPWRWRTSFYLARVWRDARDRTSGPGSTVVATAHRLLDEDHQRLIGDESLTDDLLAALTAVGRTEATHSRRLEELEKLGLVRRAGQRPPQIADPVLAAALTPLRIHHISDIHIGDKAAKTVDDKHDPTRDARMKRVADAGFVRDQYLRHIEALSERGEGPHVVIVSGDLVERADEPALLEAALSWIDRLRAAAIRNEHPCLDDEPRVLLVGGNHDVDWGQSGDPDPRKRHVPFATTFDSYPHPQLHLDIDARRAAPIEYPDVGLAVWLLGSGELGGEQLEQPHLRSLLSLAQAAAREQSATGNPWPTIGLTEFEKALSPERIDPGMVATRVLDTGRSALPLRIAVLHHPITAPAGAATELGSFTGLLNAATVKAALRNHGYQLVLHGHLHQGALLCETSHEGDHRDLHIAAAPSLGSREVAEHQGYNAIAIERLPTRSGRVPEAEVHVRRMVYRGQSAAWREERSMSFRVTR